MNENIKVLVEKVSGNDEMLAKFSACGSVDEAFELAKGIVGGFTKEEFVEAMTALSAADDGDISDDELAGAAGGEGEWNEGLSIISEAITDAEEAVTLPVVFDSISKVTDPVGESIVKSATEVSKSISKSADVISKSATEVSKSIKKSLSKVSEPVSKVTKALAV